MTLRAAVVGTSFGGRIHVPALRLAGFEVVALVGQDPDRTARRAERLGVERGCTSLTEALEWGLDAVSIATPPATHAPLAHEAMAAGCHVLCEKPFTLTTAEAVGLAAAVAAEGLVGCVGHEFRWALDRAVAARAIAAGRIGEPVLVVHTSFIPMLRQFSMPAWWFDAGAGGGWLGASGSHLVDQLELWLGEISAVSAGMATVLAGAAVEDSFDVRFRCAGGAHGVLAQCASAFGPSAGSTRLVGTQGSIWLEGGRALLADEANPDGAELAVPPDLELPDVGDEARGALAEMTRMELAPYVRLAEAFGRRIDGAPDAPGPRPATFADGVSTMAVLEAIRSSAAAGGRWTEVVRGGTDG